MMTEQGVSGTTATARDRGASVTSRVGVALAGACLLLAAGCTMGGETDVDSDPDARAPAGHGIWSDDVDPSAPAAAEHRAVTLGVEFAPAVDGSVTGVQFYRFADPETVRHDGGLWSESGKLLAKGELTPISESGWVTVAFDHPVRVKAGTTYTASYTAPHGAYAADEWRLGPKTPAVTKHLTAWLGVFTYGRGMPTQSWHHTNYYVDPVFRPDPGAERSGTTTQPSPTTSAPTGKSSASAGGFPDAATTGVPAGTKLTPYDGPCRITRPGTVIDARTVDCNLTIRAPDVVITDSVINGSVSNAETSSGLGFTIEDSEVHLGDRGVTGIGSVGFTALRVEVTGGNRSIYCWRGCTVRDSWVHDQFSDESGAAHESGIRMGSDATIVHNRLACDAPTIPPDAGCSAGLTGYGDFGIVQRNLVQDNFFVVTPGATCAYGGSSSGKTYSDRANNIRFIDNVFQRGPKGGCGIWAAIMDFDPSAPGNVWRGNRWDDGGRVPPG